MCTRVCTRPVEAERPSAREAASQGDFQQSQPTTSWLSLRPARPPHLKRSSSPGQALSGRASSLRLSAHTPSQAPVLSGSPPEAASPAPPSAEGATSRHARLSSEHLSSQRRSRPCRAGLRVCLSVCFSQAHCFLLHHKQPPPSAVRACVRECVRVGRRCSPLSPL